MIISVLTFMAIAAGTEAGSPPSRTARRNKVVCEKTTVTGTRFSKRRCMKQSDRDRISNAAVEGFQSIQNSQQINPAEQP